MPRILRIINRFNLGGPTYNAAYLTHYLEEKGFETKLIGGINQESEANSEYILKSLNVNAEVIPEMQRSINILNDRKAYTRIKQIIQEFKPDIVHTHASKAGTLGRLAAIQQNVPVIIHTFHGHVFHSYFSSSKTTIFKKVEQYLALKSTKIIAISNKQKAELSLEHKIAPEDKIKVIPLGFDLSRFKIDSDIKRKNFRERWRITDDEIIISIVGRLVPVKNHRLFIESIAALKKKTTKKVIAYIVGDGELRESLTKHCELKGLKIRTNGSFVPNVDVVFTSWIKNVDEVYAGSDIVALSSYNEGTPVSLIEAMTTGKAVISTNVGGIEDIIKNKNTGVLVPSDNVEKFSKELLNLVENNNLRNNLSQNAKINIDGQFDYENLVSRTSNLYYDLLEQKTKKHIQEAMF